MKRTNRFLYPVIVTLFLCLCAAYAHADRILYTYDASGNRTYSNKEILLRGDGLDQDNDRRPRHQDLSMHRVTIHPNPTEGRFSVEITGDGALEGASITIYGATGSIVYYDDDVDAVNDIDITPCTNGIYLLIIRVDGETSSWKIIKI